MVAIESQLSEQVLGSLAADILAPLPPTLGLISATQFVDGGTPQGASRITLNWAAPTLNEIVCGELFKNPDDTPDLAEGSAGATHEAQFDPIAAGTFTVHERTATSANSTTLSASTIHGQRRINVNLPVPVDIIADSFLVVEDTVLGKEELCEVKSVNTGTGEIILKAGLFYTHASGSNVREVTLVSKTETTHYTIDLPTGVIMEVAAGFTAGNKIYIKYQTTVQDLDHFELYRVPGNAVVTNPTKAEVLIAGGVVTVDAAIAAVSTSFQDTTLVPGQNGTNETYYLFAVDSSGNASNVISEVMTDNLHLVFVETFPTVPQNLSTQVSTNKVVVSWGAIAGANSDGYNLYRSPGATYDPNTAIKLNSSLIAKGTGTVTFDDSADNVSNRVPGGTAPFPLDGETFAYKLESEDTVSFWSDGTSNQPPPVDSSASKTTGVGDGSGGR